LLDDGIVEVAIVVQPP